eukprot:6685591-Prymnesium_polylepis.1
MSASVTFSILGLKWMPEMHEIWPRTRHAVDACLTTTAGMAAARASAAEITIVLRRSGICAASVP